MRVVTDSGMDAMNSVNPAVAATVVFHETTRCFASYTGRFPQRTIKSHQLSFGQLGCTARENLPKFTGDSIPVGVTWKV